MSSRDVESCCCCSLTGEKRPSLANSVGNASFKSLIKADIGGSIRGIFCSRHTSLYKAYSVCMRRVWAVRPWIRAPGKTSEDPRSLFEKVRLRTMRYLFQPTISALTRPLRTSIHLCRGSRIFRDSACPLRRSTRSQQRSICRGRRRFRDTQREIRPRKTPE